MKTSGIFKTLLASLLMLSATGCDTLIEDRIPTMPVYIEFPNAGFWNVYGVAGWGESREFIKSLRIPSNFPYNDYSATGYGGVMLVYEQHPFSLEVGPLAYDLSCPVEKKPTVRVAMTGISDEGLPLAQCPVCHSMYNVTERGGSPVAGPALSDNYKLRMYECLPTANNSGGYLVTNRW